MFTIDELTLIKMYSGLKPERNQVIAALKEALPDVDEQEIKGNLTRIIQKLENMEDVAFQNLDFSLVLDEFSPNENI